MNELFDNCGDGALRRRAESVGQALVRRGWRAVTAESCTGGWIAKCLTDIPGSSGWFEGGFVTYSNDLKEQVLAVDPDAIERHGAVSRPVVEAMTAGALARSEAAVAVAVSGVAGPDGGTVDKPVGLVWFAWRSRDGHAESLRRLLPGDREAIRRQTVALALDGILAFCEGRSADCDPEG